VGSGLQHWKAVLRLLDLSDLNQHGRVPEVVAKTQPSWARLIDFPIKGVLFGRMSKMRKPMSSGYA
jgi:hypothetical protein